MEAVATFLKVTFPKYLKSLPLPDNFSGFAKLSGEQWIALVPLFLVMIIHTMAIMRYVMPKRRPKPMINREIKKESPKVVDQLKVDNLPEEKLCYCRCWKSQKFPLCDGSHNRHNEETHDNVGPLVITKKEKK